MICLGSGCTLAPTKVAGLFLSRRSTNLLVNRGVVTAWRIYGMLLTTAGAFALIWAR
jgi:hypothetical protein